MTDILPAALGRRRYGSCAAFPHVGFGMEPYGSGLSRELVRILKQVRYDALQLRRVERKMRELVVGQKIKSNSFLLKAVRPQPADSRQAIVDVAHLNLHAQPAGLEGAVSQEVLDELLQAFAAVAHI